MDTLIFSQLLTQFDPIVDVVKQLLVQSLVVYLNLRDFTLNVLLLSEEV